MFIKKKIIFFIRHFNDYDHFTPVIWSLLKTQKFEVSVLLMNPFSESLIRNNYRTNLLKKMGAEIIGFSNSKYNFKFLMPIIGTLFRYNNFFFNLNLFAHRLGKFILYIFFKKKFQEKFIKETSINLIKKNYKILVFDHMVDDLRKDRIKYSKIFKCKCVSLPHGVTLFRYKKKWLNNHRKKVANTYKIFDKIVFPNNSILFYKEEKEVLKKKFLSLGSPRFSKIWINFIKKNIKIINLKQKKIKILFLVEKSEVFIHKRKHVVADFCKQLEALSFLKSRRDLTVKIKFNTRDVNLNQRKEIQKNYNNDISNLETSDLVEWSDIVIAGGGTSSIIQPICLNKTVICCTYFHPEHHFYFKKFKFPIEVKKFSDLVNIINNKKIIQIKSNNNRKKFLDYIILSKKNPINLHLKFFLKL